MSEPVPDRVNDLEQKLRDTEASLAQAREALDASERKRAIERELAQQGAIDLQSAALLTEAAVADLAEADVAHAVAELKRRKPFLFRAAPGRAAAMSGEPAPRPTDLEEAAATARDSGDRRLLLRYLRLKRGA